MRLCSDGQQYCVKKRHPLIHFNGTSVLMQQGCWCTGVSGKQVEPGSIFTTLQCDAIRQHAAVANQKQTGIPGRFLCDCVFTQEPLILCYASCVDTDTALKLLLTCCSRYATPSCVDMNTIYLLFPLRAHGFVTQTGALFAAK